MHAARARRRRRAARRLPRQSSAPAALFSIRRKTGSTSAQPQPGLPSASQSSKSCVLAADVDHGVDRARPAEHLAARPVARAPAEPRHRVGHEHPVDSRVVEGLAVADRHPDPEAAVAAAGLEQQHPEPPVRGQPVGQHAAGRPGADDDVVEALHPWRFRTGPAGRYRSIDRNPRRPLGAGCGADPRTRLYSPRAAALSLPSSREARGMTEPRTVRIGALAVSNAAPLTLIAGPCQLEGRDHALMIAETPGRGLRRRRRRLHLQVLLRQGEPHLALGAARPRPRRGPGDPRRRPRPRSAARC